MASPDANEPAGNERKIAQELADQAQRVRAKEEALALVRRALELDGECADAQILLARENAGSAKELIAQLKLILERAEAKLGAPFLRDHRGDLWSIPEARPYLRARLALAEACEKAGKPAMAVPHLEDLLRADAEDHQGARFRLIRCLLAGNDPKALLAALKRWEGDASAFMAWASVLERIHAKSEPGAVKALARARGINPHFEEFLTGRRRLPKRLPETAVPGSVEEAALAIRLFGETWSNDREGMYWLFRHS